MINGSNPVIASQRVGAKRRPMTGSAKQSMPPRAGRWIASSLALLAMTMALGGCDFQTFKSSVAGSCAVFERPPYAVRGKTSYDQNVADNFVESGVAGCNWQRPAPRPASLDASPGKAGEAPPAKKRGLVRRIRDRVKAAWPARAAAPVLPTPQPPPSAVDPSPPAPPPKPRSAIDELLQPDDPAMPRLGR